MAQSEIEPATSSWDEHKPPVEPAMVGKGALTFAKVCLFIAVTTGLSLLFLIATTILTDALPDELGFGLWSVGGGVSLLAVMATGIAALLAGSRNRPAMRLSIGALLANGASLTAHVLTAMYVLSTISFC